MGEKHQMDHGQYLTFTLGREVLALDISKVREVLELTSISQIPRTPDFMRGVINLRGHAVPVVDMRRKLNMAHKDDTVETCIIITEIQYEADQLVLGILVDSVREVFEMAAKDIEPAPRMGAAISTDYIKGMGRQDGTFVIIVDMDSIFSIEELEVAAQSNLHRGDAAA